MSEVRVKTWPLALVGSVLVHVSALTGVYLAPATGASGSLAKGGVGNAPIDDTVPLYLIPDELPADVAARLAADQANAAKAKPNAKAPPAEPKPEKKLAEKPETPLEPIPIGLGVVDGPKINTETWMESKAPGEHSAILAEVNQPRQDLNAKPAPQGMPGDGGANGEIKKNESRPDQAAMQPLAQSDTPAVLPPMITPSPLVAESTPPKPIAPSPPQSKDGPTERAPIAEVKPTREVAEGPSKPEVKAGNSGGETPEVVQAASEPRVKPVEPTAPKPAANAAAGGTTGGTKGEAALKNEKSAAPGAPGEPTASPKVASDRDSDAASVKRSAVFRNGKVEAGEGLDIRTVRPEFSLTTRALVQPKSPTLEIVFGKDGRAKRVKVLKSSGFPAEVDEPVVAALYNWRAKGRVLDQLPSRPDATVALEITIILQ